jgi:amidophosphoribosyltransferase
VRSNGAITSRICAPVAEPRPCIFEHVYFSRPDSTIDGVSVHAARLEMGRILGERILKENPDHGIDVVVPVPDSGRIAALELARTLGVQYREGFVKNRYIGRTFIMPGQNVRKKSVRKKLNTILGEFQNKNVLIVDDSIVRGNTSKRIVEMARSAGAEQVFFASCAPPVIHPNVYGIDMPAREEYIAHNRTVDEIGDAIGADWMIYQ